MFFDWITWGVWSLGLGLLLFWCYQTFYGFRLLFSKRKDWKSGGPENQG